MRRLIPWMLAVAAPPLTLAWTHSPLGAASASDRIAISMNPRILIVNDDGIDSAGIAALVQELSPLAEVVVCAPDGNRSGASASTSALSEAMTIEERTLAGAASAWAVGGQPVDAVQFGLFRLGPTEDPSDFDLVISGINRGANVGNVQQYSGTVGAASAAVHYGVPAVAVSQATGLSNFTFAAEVTRRFVQLLSVEGATPGVVYSINVPVDNALAVSDVSPAPQGGDYFLVRDFEITINGQGLEVAQALVTRPSTHPAGSDTQLFQSDQITITPLRIDRTDASTLAAMQSWTF